VVKQIRERAQDRLAFFTFDIDFVDPSSAPGTVTIEAEGFNSHETLSLVRGIHDLNFVAFGFASIIAMHRKNHSLNPMKAGSFIVCRTTPASHGTPTARDGISAMPLGGLSRGFLDPVYKQEA
jgi:hypothetical protein